MVRKKRLTETIQDHLAMRFFFRARRDFTLLQSLNLDLFQHFSSGLQASKILIEELMVVPIENAFLPFLRSNGAKSVASSLVFCRCALEDIWSSSGIEKFLMFPVKSPNVLVPCR